MDSELVQMKTFRFDSCAPTLRFPAVWGSPQVLCPSKKRWAWWIKFGNSTEEFTVVRSYGSTYYTIKKRDAGRIGQTPVFYDGPATESQPIRIEADFGGALQLDGLQRWNTGMEYGAWDLADPPVQGG